MIAILEASEARNPFPECFGVRLSLLDASCVRLFNAMKKTARDLAKQYKGMCVLLI